jgi:K+-sensing histidine kinase KdpD
MQRLSVWIVLAVVVPIAIAVALIPVRDGATSANLALAMVLGAVVVAAASNRIGVSILCAAMTGLAYDFFLVHPYYSITIAVPNEALTAVLVLAVVAVVGTISTLFRRQRTLTERREENLGLLYQLVEQVATAAGETALVGTSERELAELLGALDCRFIPASPDGSGDDHQPADDGADEMVITAVGELQVGADVVDPSEAVTARRLALPVQSAGLRFGRFRIDAAPGHTIARWELIVAVMIADLVGAALARWPVDN